MRLCLTILLIMMFCLTGCQVKQTALPRPAIDSPVGMSDYLTSRNLPALKKISDWENPYGPGLKLETEHYLIYTTLLSPLMLSQVPGFMESCYQGYTGQMSNAAVSGAPMTVYLFADRSQWEAFTVNFAGEQAAVYKKIKSGAYYLDGACVAYNIGIEKTFSVLGHEGWHQFSGRHFSYRLPSWLDEGAAMMFEVNSYKEGFYYFEPDRNMYRLAPLKMALIENKMMPLSLIISLNPGEVLAMDNTDSVSGFYAQSYALIRFLREENFGEHFTDYQRIMADGLYGKWPIDAAEAKIAADRNIRLTVNWNKQIGRKLFKTYIAEDIDQLNDEYMKFCRKIVYHVHLR